MLSWISGNKFLSNNSIFKLNYTNTIQAFQNKQGSYYINNYQIGYPEQLITTITTNKQGEMIFGHNLGLSVFNGNIYKNIKLPEIPLCLKFDENKNQILIGCKNDYGYLKKNNKGEYEFTSLKPKNIKAGEINEIKITDLYIYFYSNESILCHDRNNLKLIKALYAKPGEKHFGIIQFGNQVYLNKKNSGFIRVDSEGKNGEIPNSKALSANNILFSFFASKNRLIIGTEKNKLFLFDGSRISEYILDNQKYIDEHTLVNGINLSEEFFVLSTQSGGILVVDKNTSEIESIVNYQNGLPDDEVFAMGLDIQGGLWISHGFGISRLHYQIPVRDYSKYPGIEGNIVDVVTSNNTIYIATSQGVFYLDSVKDIKEYETIIKKQKAEEKTEGPIVPIEEIKGVLVKDIPAEDPIKKKNIWQKWKENREKKRQEKKKSNISEEEKKELTNPLKQLEKKTPEQNSNIKVEGKEKKKTGQSILKIKTKIQELSYVYKKVKDISGKCKQIVKFGDQLLIASNNGLYIINNNEANLILKKTYINFIQPSATEGVFYIGTDSGITLVKYEKNKWVEIKKIKPKNFKIPIYSISEDENRNLWLASSNSLYYLEVGENFTSKSIKNYSLDNQIHNKSSIKIYKNQTYFLLSRQIFRYDKKTDKIIPDNSLLPDMPVISDYIVSNSNLTWFNSENSWKYLSDNYKITDKQVLFLSMFNDIQNIKIDENQNLWIIDINNNLFKIKPTTTSDSLFKKFNVFLEKIQEENGELISLDNITLSPDIKSLTLKISAPYYLKPEGTKYQYFIEGRMKNWSEWKSSPSFDFLVYPGKFKIKLRAKNIFGDISYSNEYIIDAEPPLWKKTWFILSLIAFTLLLLTIAAILIIKRRERNLQRDKKRLERRVAERTFEIRKQKEQIEFKNKEITDSLNYASQIQSAILPPIETLNGVIDEYFVINMPKDIVSGDFYWISRSDDKLIVTAADCTGHGVPGAFLSLLGVTYLNEITNKIKPLKANLILDNLRDRVIESLNQQQSVYRKRYDGIDLSLAIIDHQKMELQFAGANNPIYIIRKGHLTEIKGNRMPVGIQALKVEPFTNHVIEIKKDDKIYMFSDGFTDQFGGNHGKKFLSRNFKILLTETAHLDMQEQEKTLRETFALWKGQYDQIDDVLIIGLKI
jgi:serine phosphatase RsbU (regulator of sigma subunit)/ligand-binding sensor domain-containing protein